jgi:hypothetical protein
MGKYKGNKGNRNPRKFEILAAMARRPELTTYEAAEIFDVNRHTIAGWCREAGIKLDGHKHPRVSFILSRKKTLRKRLIADLAVVEREIKVLEDLDPDAPYIKPKKAKT